MIARRRNDSVVVIDAELDAIIGGSLALRMVANGITDHVFERIDDQDLWYFERSIADDILAAARPDDGIDVPRAADLAAALVDHALGELADRWRRHRELCRQVAPYHPIDRRAAEMS